MTNSSANMMVDTISSGSAMNTWTDIGFWLLIMALPVLVYFIDKFKARAIKVITDYIINQIDGIDIEIINRYKKINENLIKLLVEMSADRVYIVEFHNGQRFVTNQPIWKLSCTYEYCRPGISSEMSNMQSIPISGLIESISSLWGEVNPGFTSMEHLCEICKNRKALPDGKPAPKNDKCKLKKVILAKIDDLPEGFYKAVQNMNGTKYIVLSPLVYDEQIIGYLAASYCSSEIFESLSSKSIEKFHKICTEATTLSYYLVNKKN